MKPIGWRKAGKTLWTYLRSSMILLCQQTLIPKQWLTRKSSGKISQSWTFLFKRWRWLLGTMQGEGKLEAPWGEVRDSKVRGKLSHEWFAGQERKIPSVGSGAKRHSTRDDETSTWQGLLKKVHLLNAALCNSIALYSLSFFQLHQSLSEIRF